MKETPRQAAAQEGSCGDAPLGVYAANTVGVPSFATHGGHRAWRNKIQDEVREDNFEASVADVEAR